MQKDEETAKEWTKITVIDTVKFQHYIHYTGWSHTYKSTATVGHFYNCKNGLESGSKWILGSVLWIILNSQL